MGPPGFGCRAAMECWRLCLQSTHHVPLSSSCWSDSFKMKICSLFKMLWWLPWSLGEERNFSSGIQGLRRCGSCLLYGHSLLLSLLYFRPPELLAFLDSTKVPLATFTCCFLCLGCPRNTSIWSFRSPSHHSLLPEAFPNFSPFPDPPHIVEIVATYGITL